MTDTSIIVISAAFLLIFAYSTYLHFKLKNKIEQEAAKAENRITQEIAETRNEIAKADNWIIQENSKTNSKITQEINILGNRIGNFENKNSGLNTYLNDVIDRLDSLLQKPNDLYILAKKKRKTSGSIVDIKIEDIKQDDFFIELMDSLDFRDKELNFKTQSKFVDCFRDCKMVLDIGCGKGDFLELCKINNIPAIGIDTSKKAIDACLERGLNAQKADVFEFLSSKSDVTYDGMFCSHLIEHFDPEKVAALFLIINNRLEENGKFLVITPNVESFETQTIHFWRDLTHIRFYQKDSLTKMMEFFGFEILKAKFDDDTKGAKFFETKWVV